MKFFSRSLLLLLPVLLLVSAPSAAAPGSGDEWRPISPAELALKTPTVEPDADAEAIFWEVRIDDSSDEELSMRHYVRVKVFTDRGREKYSKFDIPFSKGKKIKDIAARVVAPDGSAIEILKDDIFEREIIKGNGIKIKAKSFAVPKLEPGSIIEYRYREVISDAGASGMHLKFQRDIPVQNLSYYYKPYNKKTPNYQSFNFDDTKFVEDEKGFWVATRKNIPALKEEPDMPPEDQIVPWMLLQSVRINITGSLDAFTITIKDPGNPLMYWSSVGHEKSVLTTFMNKPDKEISKTAADITSAASTPEEKLQKLYDFVQGEIKNTTFDTTVTDDQRKKSPEIKSIGDVLKRKAAASQYINLLFGAMANSLGYETRVALCADRSQVFFKPEMTNESFIRPAAIAVKIGTEWKFYEPGISFLPAGTLLWNQEAVWALLVAESGSLWVKTPLSDFDKSVDRRTGRFKLLEDGTLEGDVKIEYSGQSGLSYKLENYDKSERQREDDFTEQIKQRMSTAEVSNFTIQNATDPKKPVIIAYKLRVAGYAQKTGKRLFLQPSVFEHGQVAHFSGATRKYSVYFHYPWSQSDDIEIELPAGYALDNADKPPPFAAGNISQYKLSIGITTDGKTLVMKRDFFFGGAGNLIFPAARYDQVKALFDKLHTNDEHTISIKAGAGN